MKQRIWLPLLLMSGWLFLQCLPDRMPPAPVENERPDFRQFAREDSGAFAVPLRDPVIMEFSEPMMFSSFPDHFRLESRAGAVSGTFSGQDSTVVFSPTEDMAPASYYVATIRGGVKDQNGNSLTLESDWSAATWFFTAGQYSDNGFPYVYIADRSFDKVYQVGNFNEFLNESAAVPQPRSMAFTPDGQYLLVVSKLVAGKLMVVDPATFAIAQEVEVGVGPEEIAVASDKLFVVNVSGRSISVLGYPGFSALATLEFSDGFTPRDIAYHPGMNRLYVSSNALGNPGLFKVLDAANFQELETLQDLISGRRTEKMQVSSDEQYVVIQQERSDLLHLLDINSHQLAQTITIPVPQNKDMDIYDNMLYVASSGGYVYKYDLNSAALVDSLGFDSGCDGVAVAPFGEILYVSTAVDSSVHAVDVGTLHRIRSVKVASTISKLIITPENY